MGPTVNESNNLVYGQPKFFRQSVGFECLSNNMFNRKDLQHRSIDLHFCLSPPQCMIRIGLSYTASYF